LEKPIRAAHPQGGFMGEGSAAFVDKEKGTYL
jgi:hypothetical protein